MIIGFKNPNSVKSYFTRLTNKLQTNRMKSHNQVENNINLNGL